MIICRWQHNATRVQFPADFSLHRYSKKFLPRRGSERLSHIYIYIYIAAFHTAPITSTQSVKLSTFFSTRVPHALPLFFFFFFFKQNKYFSNPPGEHRLDIFSKYMRAAKRTMIVQEILRTKLFILSDDKKIRWPAFVHALDTSIEEEEVWLHPRDEKHG